MVRRRRVRVLHWAWRGLAAAVLVVLTLGGAYLWLATSLPTLDGEIALEGLARPVEVIRDRHAVPHIYALGDEDAYFALGFVHAQDRLWQMDMLRRTGAGRLAEVVGEVGLKSDRLMRTLGLYRLAEGAVSTLGPEARAAIESYARGVNAYLESRDGAWPLEFYLLGYRPEPWRPADSLVWGRLMGLVLSRDWREELSRARLAHRLTPAQIDELWLAEPRTPAPRALGAMRHAALDPSVVLAVPEGGASNSWAIDGRHTSSGKPILANDPHLGLSLPNLWYLARVEAPGLDVTGATVPGVPFTILGHNGRIAWSMTSSQADVEDLFRERLDPAEPDSYLAPDGRLRFAVRDETIRVGGGDDVVLRVRVSRHGPVLPVAPPEERRRQPFADDEVAALSAPYLVERDRTAEALFRLNRARDWNEFSEALRGFEALHQNVLYADVDGHIGLYAAGRVPIRRAGDGFMPAPGWTGEADWLGFIPFDELPQALDPPSGQVLQANNRPVGDDYPHDLGRTWEAPYRARRIAELLAGTANHGVRDSAAMQADDLSLAARDSVPLLLAAAPPRDARAARAHAILRTWDHRMAREGAAPLIFSAWLREAVRAITADELGEEFGSYADLGPAFVTWALESDSAWCDEVTTAQLESCGQRVADALDAALADLERRYGEDMSAWSWGEAHRVRFAHTVLGRIPVLGRLAAIEFEASGDAFTLDRGAGDARRAEAPFDVVLGASYRAIYDLADLDRSLFATAAGQSGNPLSRHFRDFADGWRAFRFIELSAGREDALGEAVGVLRLVPRRTPEAP
ncbi:MAG: penicillin acylase family protein [Alphaproteobacteria bacterium]